MLAKVSIWLSMAFFSAALVLGAMASFDVGLSDPPPRADEAEQRLVDFFEVVEEEYLLYGRWIDLGWALGFVGLLVAIPFLPMVARAKHVLISGAVLGVAGDMIDLSKLAGIEIARIGLDQGLESSFAGGNVFRAAINTTSTYVWITGLFIFALGLAILAWDSTSTRWKACSYFFAASLVAVGITGPWTRTPYPEAATTIATIAVVLWGIAAVRRVGAGMTTSDGRRP